MDLSPKQILSQIQSLRQEQIIAPQQIQSLEILLATIPELEQKISEELAQNPTLELIRPGSQELIGNPIEENGHIRPDPEEAGQAGDAQEALAALIELGEFWEERTPYPRAPRGSYTEDDEKRIKHALDSLTDEQTLQDFLLLQLRETDTLTPEQRRIAEEIIGSIDDAGYLRTHPADIAIACHTDLPTVEKVLKVIQSFDPPGVGAADLRECLLLQLERAGRKDTLEYQIVDRFLEKIGRNKIPEIARALGVSPARVYEAIATIRRVTTPFPGSAVSNERPNYVSPELFIEKDENGKWQVQTNRDHLPRLRISPQYLALLKSPDTPADVKSYIRSKLLNSRTLLRALQNRESTLARIGRRLLDHQREFFENGPGHLRPLTMSRIADELGVHETTISRAVANKYVQTPHGLFPLRYFFTSGIHKTDGTQVSSTTVKQRIQELVNEEDKTRPLSDQKIAEILNKEGYNVARRTVAKYREELGIPSSHMRRVFAE